MVDRLTDLTNDLSDLEELLKDAERVGVKVFELSTMQFRNHVYLEGTMDMDSLMEFDKDVVLMKIRRGDILYADLVCKYQVAYRVYASGSGGQQ